MDRVQRRSKNYGTDTPSCPFLSCCAKHKRKQINGGPKCSICLFWEISTVWPVHLYGFVCLMVLLNPLTESEIRGGRSKASSSYFYRYRLTVSWLQMSLQLQCQAKQKACNMNK
jgi:hypothetical protein